METNQRFREFCRRQLEERLERISEAPLVLVVAPMGYGKTTIVNSYLRKQTKDDSIWLTLGQNEVDSGWMWQRLCCAVSLAVPELAEQLKELGSPSTNYELENFVTLLQESVKKKTVLVVDDYQECKSPIIDRLLVRVAYEDIKNFKIILISRHFPDIPYEEMMLKGYCEIIDQKMLTLREEEIKQIFSEQEMSLKEEELRAVYLYTDGWIAAVYLSLLEYRKVGQFRLSVGVRHLLKTAVYDQMPGSIREFLMKMSVFDSFTLEEACFTAQCDVYSVVLDETIEQFGFMHYDRLTGKYSMHALLRAVGEAELEKRGLDKKVLYHRYAQYNARIKNVIPAFIYYDKAGHPEAVLELIHRGQNWEYVETASVILEEFFDKTELDLCLKYEDVYMAYLCNLFLQRNPEKGRRLYGQALRRYFEIYGTGVKKSGSFFLMENILFFNRLGDMSDCLEQAMLRGTPGNYALFGMVPLTFGVPETLVLYHRTPGRLKEMISEEKRYARLYAQITASGENGWDSLYEGEYCLTRGNIEDALRLAELTLKKAKLQKKTCIVISCYTILLRGIIGMGEAEKFRRYMDEMIEYMHTEKRSIFLMDFEISMGYALALAGHAEYMAPWLQKFDLSDCNYVVRSLRCGCRAYGLKLCFDEEWEMLDAVAEQMMVPYGDTRHVYVEMQACIFKAVALTRQNQEQEGIEYLKKGLAMAAEDEIRMPFMEAGHLLIPLLRKIEGKITYASQMLEYCQKYQKGRNMFFKVKAEPISLTAREWELMELVKRGYRNVDISKQMNIALVTVEKNLTSIYRKLEVKNRTKAVQVLKNLGDGVKKSKD